MTLSATVKGRFGLRVAQVHVDEHPRSAAMRAHFSDRSAAPYRSLVASEERHGIRPSATHNMGTARISRDPTDGVVNSFGEAQEVPHLFVSNGSQFVTSTARNPTLTIVAFALRQAEHIAGRLASGDPESGCVERVGRAMGYALLASFIGGSSARMALRMAGAPWWMRWLRPATPTIRISPLDAARIGMAMAPVSGSTMS